MTTTVHQLLATADRLLSDVPGLSAASRHRGAAFALRSAVELAVADALRAAQFRATEVGMRAKFLCLRGCTDPVIARRAAATWGMLCLGCHYHHYELGPSHGQVRAWRAEVGVVVGLLGA